MQTVYGHPGKLTYVGDIVSQNKEVESAPALEKIHAGSIIGYVGTEIKGIQNPSANKFILSADTVTSNVINLKVTVKTVNGEKEVITTTAISPVTFTSTHAGTMNLIKAAIQTADSNLIATVDSSDANSRTIYVTHASNAVVIISDVLVTAGSSQATASYGFYGTLLAPALRAPYEANKDGSSYHPPTAMVGYMTKGTMTIKSIDAMNLSSSIYAQFIEDTNIPRGSIRTSSASGKATAFSAMKPNMKVSALSKANVKMNTP